MNVGDIVLSVQRQFGDTSGAQVTRTDILRWMNEGQLDIVRRTECLEEHRQTNMIASDGSYPLPDNFLMMKRCTIDDIIVTQKLLEDLDQISVSVDQFGTGTPRFYYVWGSVLFLFPAPGSAGTNNLDIWYIKQPTTLVNDADIPEIPVWMHLDLVRYCLSRAKELDDDLDGARIIYKDYQDRVSESQFELHAQPQDSYPAVRSLPGDMY